MRFPSTSKTVAIVVYEPKEDALYSIEDAATMTRVSRHLIAVYCRYGLVSPIMDPESGGWLFNDDAIRTLRRIEQLRAGCGMNMTAIQMVLRLSAEVERLRAELRMLRGF